MVLIFSHNITPRLEYITSFIFKEVIGIEYSITNNVEIFKQAAGIKINYSKEKISEHGFCILPHSLLFEKEITPQNIDCFEHKGNKAFFKMPGADYSFDLFAASFYLLSRYEEYLPHKKDEYGRYDYKNSLAYKEGFLTLPLINIWIKDFAETLKTKYSMLNTQYSMFNFEPTYDIDIVYSYKHKGWLRNIGGFIKSPSIKRFRVLLNKEKDPFDSYNELDALHEKYNLKPIYFFLLAQQNKLYDKNILPHKPCMQQLIKHHAAKYTTGIHPSWQSGDADALLIKEKEILQQATGKPVTISRQHYIRFNLPEGYRKLIKAGITDDHSMGYGSINGFRASVATAFYWYDLEKEETTSLKIHPFCYMDANSFYEQHYNAEQAYNEMMHYYKVCKQVNGTLITLWHNNFVGTDKQFKGWGDAYKKFLDSVAKEA